MHEGHLQLLELLVLSHYVLSGSNSPKMQFLPIMNGFLSNTHEAATE
jgi:hypothetical protein